MSIVLVFMWLCVLISTVHVRLAVGTFSRPLSISRFGRRLLTVGPISLLSNPVNAWQRPSVSNANHLHKCPFAIQPPHVEYKGGDWQGILLTHPRTAPPAPSKSTPAKMNNQNFNFQFHRIPEQDQTQEIQLDYGPPDSSVATPVSQLKAVRM